MYACIKSKVKYMSATLYAVRYLNKLIQYYLTVSVNKKNRFLALVLGTTLIMPGFKSNTTDNDHTENALSSARSPRST